MKRLLAILLCGMLMVTMCACGGSSESEEPEQAKEPAAEQSAEPAEAADEETTEVAAADKEQKTEAASAAKKETSELEEIDAIRLASDYAVKNAVEEQAEGLVLDVENAEILDQNADAWLVSIPCLEYYEGEAAGGFIYIYRVDKKNGKVKLVTGAQDYWEGMIDITKGEMAESAAETEYAE